MLDHAVIRDAHNKDKQNVTKLMGSGAATTSAPKRVLVLSPHSDDAELGVGGYLARVVAEGGVVLVALATVGAAPKPNGSDGSNGAASQRRLAEFKRAMEVLGVQQHCVMSEGFDGRLNDFPKAEMIGMLDQLLEEFRPDEILLPLPSSHQDHTYCWEVGIAMSRPVASRHQPCLVAGYEYPATGWGAGAEFSAFKGGLYVNVEATWERKLAALREHQSQMRDADHLISLEGVTVLGRMRGLEAGFKYAELLHVVRQRWV